jgi:hypothetical protein
MTGATQLAPALGNTVRKILATRRHQPSAIGHS